jgi:glycine oxidase ThiO
LILRAQSARKINFLNPFSNSLSGSMNRMVNQQTDVLVLGGGAMGLATAIELTQRGCRVTIVSRSSEEAALFAAAGMLAPQAEGLPPGPMLELCLQSRRMYGDWTQKLERLTGLDSGYWPCGIIRPLERSQLNSIHWAGAPAVQANAVTSRSRIEPFSTLETHWLDPEQLRQRQPGLGDQIIAGLYFPQDAQVDNRALGQILHCAVEQLGIDLRIGVTVTGLRVEGDRITSIETTQGQWQAHHYVLATGAWSAEILPVPVTPRKGQMLALAPLSGSNQVSLAHVLFGEGIYLVPRQSGHIIVGATSEDVGFMPHNTAIGVQTLLRGAIALVPGLSHYRLVESWWGFRPSTPDEIPILGQGPYCNLTLATGHYRNGILLTPITAQLIAEAIVSGIEPPQLEAFSWQRFGR